jgi:exodeoxyribonuclease VII small subunit
MKIEFQGTSSEKRTNMKNQPNYTEAYEELQEIVSEIERGEISVDELSQKVKRAALLIKICKDKLTSTEGDVNQILKEMEDEDFNKEL